MPTQLFGHKTGAGSGEDLGLASNCEFSSNFIPIYFSGRNTISYISVATILLLEVSIKFYLQIQRVFKRAGEYEDT